MNKQRSKIIVKWEAEKMPDERARLAAAFDMLLKDGEVIASQKNNPLDNFSTAIKDRSE